MSAGVMGAAKSGLVIRGLRKRYGDTPALDGLDMDARPGEILGVAGPNGAGKTTLIKILAGEVREDGGEIMLDGAVWRPLVDRDRVAVVHQEPQLFPNLSVAENVMIGREGTRALVRDVDDKERLLMQDLAILEYADRPLGGVPLAIQQRVEIGRALAREARVFLFDEPNSALTDEESIDLFRRMHLLAEAGKVVLLVSHRIAELAEHADRVLLIMDGRCSGVLAGSALTREAIAAGLVTGHATREPEEQIVVSRGDKRATALQLAEWAHAAGEFRGINLHVRAGEIVAIVGVEGSGARELVRSVAGFEQATGHIEVAGRAGRSAMVSGTGFVSADRQTSLFSNLTVGDNTVSRLDSEITTGGFVLRRGRMLELAHAVRERFYIKAGSVHLPIRSLSGGNQQKVAIAAAIAKRPAVLVLEEPTRGVDIGSKREIYRLMRAYAGEGHAVIIFCTEVSEVFEAADLAYVLSDGRLSDPLIVKDYPDVEALAVAVTRLERHAAAAPTSELLMA
jgi:ABC-type sugar transport system ATPase subunit